MKLTEAHALFWMQKRGPKMFQVVPGVAKQSGILTRSQVCIHSLIPDRKDRRLGLEIQNTVSLLKMIAKREGIRAALVKLSDSATSSKRRASSCRKWLNRINQKTS